MANSNLFMDRIGRVATSLDLLPKKKGHTGGEPCDHPHSR